MKHNNINYRLIKRLVSPSNTGCKASLYYSSEYKEFVMIPIDDETGKPTKNEIIWYFTEDREDAIGTFNFYAQSKRATEKAKV